MVPADVARVVLPAEVRKPRLYRKRYIIIHTTQGPAEIGQQYGATINWFKARGGKPASVGWGPSADILVGHLGQEAWFVSATRRDWRDERANWSAGYGADINLTYGADEYGIAIEIAQTELGERPTDEALERATLRCAEICVEHEIAPVRLDYLPQLRDAPVPSGIVGHEDTANGRRTGKWDPGPNFPWDDFIAGVAAAVAAKRSPKQEYTPQQRTLLEWLEGPVGRALHPDSRRQALESVGLDADAVPVAVPPPVEEEPEIVVPDLGAAAELAVGGMQEVQRWIAAERERRQRAYEAGEAQLEAMRRRLQVEVDRVQLARK